MLESFDFVMWDRFTIDYERRCLNVYGWIDREKDSYKDFLTLKIFPDRKKIGYVTSALRYHDRIAEILDTKPKACLRVERYFPIKNVVRLKNG